MPRTPARSTVKRRRATATNPTPPSNRSTTATRSNNKNSQSTRSSRSAASASGRGSSAAASAVETLPELSGLLDRSSGGGVKRLSGDDQRRRNQPPPTATTATLQLPGDDGDDICPVCVSQCTCNHQKQASAVASVGSSVVVEPVRSVSRQRRSVSTRTIPAEESSVSLRRPTRASAIAANQALVDDSPTSENPSSSDTESDLNKDGSDSDVSNLSSSGFDDSSDDNASTEVHDPTLDRENWQKFLKKEEKEIQRLGMDTDEENNVDLGDDGSTSGRAPSTINQDISSDDDDDDVDEMLEDEFPIVSHNRQSITDPNELDAVWSSGEDDDHSVNMMALDSLSSQVQKENQDSDCPFHNTLLACRHPRHRCLRKGTNRGTLEHNPVISDRTKPTHEPSSTPAPTISTVASSVVPWTPNLIQMYLAGRGIQVSNQQAEQLATQMANLPGANDVRATSTKNNQEQSDSNSLDEKMLSIHEVLNIKDDSPSKSNEQSTSSTKWDKIPIGTFRRSRRTSVPLLKLSTAVKSTLGFVPRTIHETLLGGGGDGQYPTLKETHTIQNSSRRSRFSVPEEAMSPSMASSLLGPLSSQELGMGHDLRRRLEWQQQRVTDLMRRRRKWMKKLVRMSTEPCVEPMTPDTERKLGKRKRSECSCPPVLCECDCESCLRYDEPSTPMMPSSHLKCHSNSYFGIASRLRDDDDDFLFDLIADVDARNSLSSDENDSEHEDSEEHYSVNDQENESLWKAESANESMTEAPSCDEQLSQPNSNFRAGKKRPLTAPAPIITISPPMSTANSPVFEHGHETLLSPPSSASLMNSLSGPRRRRDSIPMTDLSLIIHDPSHPPSVCTSPSAYTLLSGPSHDTVSMSVLHEPHDSFLLPDRHDSVSQVSPPQQQHHSITASMMNQYVPERRGVMTRRMVGKPPVSTLLEPCQMAQRRRRRKSSVSGNLKKWLDAWD